MASSYFISRPARGRTAVARKRRAMPKETASAPVGILIGDVGGGKTTMYNKLCHESRDAGNHADSQTTKFAKARTTYKDSVLCLYDGPGLNSHKDVWKHSMVLVSGLTYEALNTVFIVIPYQPRINKNIIDKLADNMQILKEEHHNMIVPIITKMDLFVPDSEIKSKKEEMARIKKFILNEFDDCIQDVLFYADGKTKIPKMFKKMFQVMSKMPKRTISYSETEIAIHFQLKEWRARDIARLKTMQNRIDATVKSYVQGLHEYRETNEGDMQEIVFAAIQQNYYDLQLILDEYRRKYCGHMDQYDDFAAYLELQKMVMRGQEEFRVEAKSFLGWDPDNASDWRNCIRRCNHCGEVWIKVEGCDQATTCGNLPSGVDGSVGGSFFRVVGHLVNGVMKFTKRKETVSPESSVVFNLLLGGMRDVGPQIPMLKYAIAEALEIQRFKVDIEVQAEVDVACQLQINAHTRKVKNVLSILKQRNLFVQRFLGNVTLEGLTLQEKGISNQRVITSKKVEPTKRKAAGCGREIIWKNLQVLPQREVENFLTVAEIESIVEHISQMEAFKQQNRRKKQALKQEDKFDTYVETEISSDDEW